MNDDIITATTPRTQSAFSREASRAPEHDNARLPALDLDYAEFLPLMEDIDIGEEQKREFLETLASILRGFVEMGFNLSDADICGWIAGDSDPSLATDSDGVSSDPSTDIEKESAQGGGE